MPALTCNRIVRKLTERRHALSASLMSSTAVQNLAESQKLEADVTPVILKSGKHARSNHHRVVFSATAFPFKDPSPHTEHPELLGVRIDLCTAGAFREPYYILLKRVGEDRKSLQVHRHTIPVFIPLERLARKHLPLPAKNTDESGDALKPWKRKHQDLGRLVREVRRELVSWHLRKDAINLVRSELGLTGGRAEDQTPTSSRSIAVLLGISSVTETSIEATYLRIEWDDGRVGRIKISDRGGIIERAVVIGDDGRDKAMEALIMSGDKRIEFLINTLYDARD